MGKNAPELEYLDIGIIGMFSDIIGDEEVTKDYIVEISQYTYF